MNDKNSPTSIARLTSRIRSLSQRSARDREQSLWIEGTRPFVHAFDAGYSFELVVCSRVLLKDPLAQMIARRLTSRGVPLIKVSPEQFRRLSTAQRASGIGAILQQKYRTLDDASQRSGLGWIVIDGIRSPGNLGTLLRTAEAVGMTGAVFTSRQCDPYSPDVVRASMGGLFSLALVHSTPSEFQSWCQERGILIIGLMPGAGATWTDIPYSQQTAIVIGEERQGIAADHRLMCDAFAHLPMIGRANSLNVAVAASVMMYELVRRRAMEFESTPRSP